MSQIKPSVITTKKNNVFRKPCKALGVGAGLQLYLLSSVEMKDNSASVKTIITITSVSKTNAFFALKPNFLPCLSS